jgi:hypothetical protein
MPCAACSADVWNERWGSWPRTAAGWVRAGAARCRVHGRLLAQQLYQPTRGLPHRGALIGLRALHGLEACHRSGLAGRQLLGAHELHYLDGVGMAVAAGEGLDELQVARPLPRHLLVAHHREQRLQNRVFYWDACSGVGA